MIRKNTLSGNQRFKQGQVEGGLANQGGRTEQPQQSLTSMDRHNKIFGGNKLNHIRAHMGGGTTKQRRGMRHIPRYSTRIDRLEGCTKNLAGLVTKSITTVNATLSIDRQQTPPTNSWSVGSKQSGQAKTN
ncbi:hypothetical protein TIFTF001_020665 [Ficus carica]|uniref:Uncharacterized protein n=1 Tax=Ficus carica TaxID=3494 RepID=A0AA88DB93_FICCA|nr:hypothetical protein TIFTF001_020665 [Ficus carica]